MTRDDIRIIIQEQKTSIAVRKYSTDFYSLVNYRV